MAVEACNTLSISMWFGFGTKRHTVADTRSSIYTRDSSGLGYSTYECSHILHGIKNPHISRSCSVVDVNVEGGRKGKVAGLAVYMLPPGEGANLIWLRGVKRQLYMYEYKQV